MAQKPTARRRLTLALGAIVVVVAACGGGTPEQSMIEGLPRTVPGLEGDEVALYSPDKPTLVAFVAYWCAPCRTELPQLEEVANEYSDVAHFVGVAVQEEPAATGDLVDETGITFPVGVDPDGDVLATTGFVSMPGSLLLDTDGTVIERYEGVIDFAQLRTTLDDVD